MKLEVTTIVGDVEKTIKLEFEEYTEEIARLLEDLRIKYKEEESKWKRYY